MRWSPIGMLLAALGVLPVAAAAAQAGQPTGLRLEARTADGLYSDGRRFAIIESGRQLTILDTFKRTRRALAETGCHVGGIQFGQTQVSAGRALLNCRSGPALLTLSTGTIAPLPARLDLDGVENQPYYHAVGSHWAVADGSCPGEQGETVYCEVFVNHRTGERRAVPRPYDPAARSFLDLDDQELARRTICRPHRDVQPEGQRTYEPPYLLDGGVLRRCGSRRAVRRLPDALPDWMNLSAGWVSWGNPFLDGAPLPVRCPAEAPVRVARSSDRTARPPTGIGGPHATGDPDRSDADDQRRGRPNDGARLSRAPAGPAAASAGRHRPSAIGSLLARNALRC